MVEKLTPRFSTAWEREDWERQQRGEKPLGPFGSPSPAESRQMEPDFEAADRDAEPWIGEDHTKEMRWCANLARAYFALRQRAPSPHSAPDEAIIAVYEQMNLRGGNMGTSMYAAETAAARTTAPPAAPGADGLPKGISNWIKFLREPPTKAYQIEIADLLESQAAEIGRLTAALDLRTKQLEDASAIMAADQDARQDAESALAVRENARQEPMPMEAERERRATEYARMATPLDVMTYEVAVSWMTEAYRCGWAAAVREVAIATPPAASASAGE